MHRNMSPRGGGRDGQQSHGRRDQQDQTPSIDVAAIRFGEKVDPKLYSDIAEEAAKVVAPRERGQKNRPSQLRRFYDELAMFQERVGGDNERFAQQEPFIQMLKA